MKSYKLTCQRKWNRNKVILNNYIVGTIIANIVRVNPRSAGFKCAKVLDDRECCGGGTFDPLFAGGSKSGQHVISVGRERKGTAK